jgi:hypothetical protein
VSAKVVDQYGHVWPSQAAYFEAMEQKNPLGAALRQMAEDLHNARKAAEKEAHDAEQTP